MADFDYSDIVKEANRQAMINGLLGMGFGVLATPGSLGHAAGAGGLLGMQAAVEGRKNYIAEQMQALQLQRQQQIMNMVLGSPTVQGQMQGTQGQAPAAPAGPQTSADLMPGAGAPQAGMQPPSPAGGMGPPDADQLARLNQMAPLLKMAGMDISGALPKFQIGREGGMVDPRTGQPYYQLTPTGVQYFDKDRTFVPFSPAATGAAAAREAAVSGAKATATEQAKAQEDLIPVPIGGGQTKMMTRADAVRFLSGGGQQPQQPAMPPGTTAHFTQPLTPQQQAAVQADAQRASGALAQGATPAQAAAPPSGIGGGFGVTPDPIALEAAKANAAAMGPVYAKQHEKIDLDADKATQLQGRLTEAQGLLNMITPGAATPVRLKAAEGLQAIAPQLGISQDTINAIAGGNLGALQTFKGQMYRNAIQNTLSDMGGVPRNYMEVATELQANPGLQLTKQADQAMIDFANGAAQRFRDKQTARDEWIAQHRGDPAPLAGFEGNFNKTHPATDYLPNADRLRSDFGLTGPQGKAPAAGQAPVTRRIVYDASGRVVSQ